MQDTSLFAPRNPRDIPATPNTAEPLTHMSLRLSGEIDQLLAGAQPRLRRLARLHGLTADTADDVVQETLLEAWRSLSHLRDPSRFDAWLDGICRNVCRRQTRAEARNSAHQTSLSALSLPAQAEEAPPTNDPLDLPDPHALDPFDALSRQDLLTLLDRALSYLPPSTREALELCYLAEAPQREVAKRLGLTGNALDVRLHRARRQLSLVLTTNLRTEAEDFGLILGASADTGWSETRIWCNNCGRHRMLGTLEALPDGRTSLRLRCPECWSRYNAYSTYSSWGLPTGMHSFLPAYKRTMQCGSEYYARAVANGYRARCAECQQHEAQLRIVHADTMPIATFPGWRYFISECPTCGINSSSLSIIGWAHPTVQRFIAAHPRYVIEPDTLTEYAGSPAYRFHLTDIASAAQLTAFTHAETFAVLAIIEK